MKQAFTLIELLIAVGKYATDITELSHVFPAQCNSTGSNCGKFSLQIDTGYVFGALLKDRVEVRNSLTMDFNGNIKCYAYESDGEHGRKVCKSMGGVLQGEENGGCLNHCSIYKLNF